MLNTELQFANNCPCVAELCRLFREKTGIKKLVSNRNYEAAVKSVVSVVLVYCKMIGE
jgi:hypothetical protein